MVVDASTLAKQFEAAGAALCVPVRDAPYGREFYVEDPDGNVLAFVQSIGNRS